MHRYKIQGYRDKTLTVSRRLKITTKLTFFLKKFKKNTPNIYHYVTQCIRGSNGKTKFVCRALQVKKKIFFCLFLYEYALCRWYAWGLWIPSLICMRTVNTVSDMHEDCEYRFWYAWGLWIPSLTCMRTVNTVSDMHEYVR